MHDPDRVTLFTGAASGIGTELARVFASKRHRLALVDRRIDRLTALASEIVAAGGTTPILIPCDLEHSDACDKIAAALATEGVEVQFVVNNAGFGLFGSAIELDRAEQFGIIAVNIRAMTDLSLRFSDSLVRHRGGILNVGSLAGFLPGPGMAVFYASKAYVLSFSEALHQELAPCGVRVTTLCPGSVSTDFQARAGIKPGLEHKILNISASDVAQAGYRGLRANKRIVLPGLGTKIIPSLLRKRCRLCAPIPVICFSNQGTPPLQVAGHDLSEIARPAGRPRMRCATSGSVICAFPSP